MNKINAIQPEDFMDQFTDDELHQTRAVNLWQQYLLQSNKRISQREFTRLLRTHGYTTIPKRIDGQVVRVYSRHNETKDWTEHEQDFYLEVTRYIEQCWRDIDPMDGEPSNRPSCAQVVQDFNEWSDLPNMSQNRLTRMLKRFGYHPMSSYPEGLNKAYHRSYKYIPHRIVENQELPTRATQPPEERDRHARWVREFLENTKLDLSTTPQREVYKAFVDQYSDIKMRRFTRLIRDHGYYVRSKRLGKWVEKVYLKVSE